MQLGSACGGCVAPAWLRSALGVPWNLLRGETCPSQLQTASFARDTPVGAAHPAPPHPSRVIACFLLEIFGWLISHTLQC